MKNEDYNGWTNRETWAVGLHLSSDQDLQDEAKGMNSKQLEEFVDQLHEVSLETPENDLLRNMFIDIGSRWRVNWKELAGDKGYGIE
jgi:hypothetical protein